MKDSNRIYSYNMGSKGMKLLKNLMGTKSLHKMRPKKSIDKIINWGCTGLPDWDSNKYSWLNHVSLISTYSDKEKFFNEFRTSDLFIAPIFNYNDACNRIEEGHKLVQRSILNGHGGAGITIIDKVEDLDENCKLWTIKEDFVGEFRINAFKDPVTGQVFLVSSQRKRPVEGCKDLPEWDPDIRTEDTGWSFCELRGSKTSDQKFNKIAISAVLDYFNIDDSDKILDFGGFDIGITRGNNKPYIIEINTAPGLGEVNAKGYAEVFTKWSCGTISMSEEASTDNEELLLGVIFDLKVEPL